ncbi:MAG: RNA methyltransferase [Acidobacteriota bacterium]
MRSCLMSAPERIASRQHPIVRRCREIARRQGPPELVLLDGEHLVSEALAAHVRLEAILTDDLGHDVIGRARVKSIPIHECTTAVLEAASPATTPSGMVAIASWAPRPLVDVLSKDPALVIALVDVQDPGNVGGVIRTADALGATGVIAAAASADPAGWKALRGGMGSTFRIPVARVGAEELLTEARRRKLLIAATVARGGQSIQEVDLTTPLLVLLGNEGAGLREDLVVRCDVRLTIPMRDRANSLNVGVSAALVLWEAQRQREGAQAAVSSDKRRKH